MNPNDVYTPGIDLLLSDQNTSVATAHVLYWMLGAPWFVCFRSSSELPVDDWFQRKNFERLRNIEHKIEENFFTDHGISFDVMSSCWEGCKPNDYPEKEVLRPIPSFMLSPVEGHLEADWVNSDCQEEGLPEVVAVAIHNAYKNMANDQ